MKQPDCISTQPMKASLQDFAVALFFMSCIKLMFLNFESVDEILRCGTFFTKTATRWNISSELSCTVTSSRHRWMMLIPMWLTTPNLRIQPFPRRVSWEKGCIRRLAKCGTKLKHFMNTPERSRQKHMAEIYKWVHICCSSGVLELAHPFEVATPSPRPNIIK